MNLRKNKFRIALIIAFTMLFQIFQPVVSGLTLANERDNTEVLQEEELGVDESEEKLDLGLQKKEETAEKGKNEAQKEEELNKSEDDDKLDKFKADDIKEAKDNQEKLHNETEEKKKPDVEINETEDLKDSNKEIIEKEENVELQANREAKKIEENIIDDMKLLYKDGTEFKDGNLIPIDEDLRFELDWSLSNDKDYVEGDYFEFQLPKQITVNNPLDGPLGDYGTYTVDTYGNVKFTFNEKVEKESDINGTFWFDTELKESEITSTEETIELVINREVVQEVEVKVKPKGGQVIAKKGKPIDGNFNTQEIEWTVVVNTARDSLNNAIIDDPILAGQELILDSVKLTEVEVDLAGKVTKDLDEVTGFTNNSTTENLNIELGDTNKAYKLTFKTKLLEKDFKEGTTKYENKAFLKSDEKNKDAGGSVSVSRPKSIEKTSTAFDKEARSIEWTVNANFTEQNLKKDDVITDKFTFTVDGNELNDVFEIKKEKIEILQVDSFDSSGNSVDTSDAKDLFDITVVGNKVTYKLKKDSNKAFILKYKTEVKDGAYINKDGKITNKIDLNGKTATGSQGVIQQVGKKTNAGINYEDKTIDWKITVNADKQDLHNFVLTDSFAGSGQKLVANSIEIKPEIDASKVNVNDDKEGFEINFGNIKEKYVITYQTKFTYDFKNEGTYEKPIAPNFKNGVKITYKAGEDGSDYELGFDNTVTPNKETKSNGAKNGSVNNETKEITWTVDINYNQLALDNAKMKDTIPDNQLLIDGSVKVYETSIASDGKITPGNEVTNQDTININANKNQVNVDFGEIDKSYRVEFKTKDKDGIYNSDEKYTNGAQFIPRKDEVHNLTANVTLPNQGEFIGKTGKHNTKDWTIDWKIDVNKSLSTTSDFTVTDNLGDPAAQILLEDTIKVTKAGSTEELEEGKDYKITVEGNEFEIYFPGEITEAYEITYSSYIIVEENETENGTDIKNEAKIKSNDVIKGTTEKTETVTIKISTGGGTGEGTTGGLVLDKFEADSERKLKDISFKLIKTIGNKNIVVREGVTDDNGKLEWKGLKYGKYTLREEIPEGYLGEAEREVELSSKDPKGVKTLRVENTRETGEAKIIKVDSVTGELLKGAAFTLINQTTNQEYTFETDDDGVILEEIPFGEYTVKEIIAPEGYRITKDILRNINVEIGKTATIEVENVAFVDVVGQKTWITDKDKELPKEITVELLADGKNIAEQKVTKNNNWKYSFKNLDKYGTDNKEISYEIKEVDVDGYNLHQDGYDLINIQANDIKGTKEWINGPEVKPQIKLQLYRNEVALGEPITLVDGQTEYTWKGLDKYDESGKEFFYKINEIEELENYDKTISKDGLTVTNTYIIPKTTVKGTKKWVNGQLVKPEVKLQLYKDEVALGEAVTLENGKTEYEWTDLDKTDINGKEHVYRVDEIEGPENYYKTISEDGLTITNTYVSPKTEVTGTKVWIDGPEVKPTIELQLYRNGETFGDPVELVDGETQYTWTDLDLTDKDGTEYKYTIDEVERPENYGKSRSEDKLTITNTYKSPVTDVVGRKVWIGGPEEKATIKLQLYRNNEAIFDPVELADGEAEYTWKDLDLTDKNGKEYEYTVKEVNVPENYEKVEEGLTVTNKYVSPKTEITGTKVWIDGPEKKPTIELQLYRNGEAFGEPVKLKDGSAEYVWKDLDLTDENGLEYKYTIDEVNVPENYTKTLSEDGLKVTNKYSEPVKPTDPEKPTKPSEPGLPPTGTQSTIVFTLLGIMIVLIGMTLWFNERKRKSNTK